ncbi:MAG TPA: demethylmenaquinone methyltransferase [Streptosporangiaceae bacterium]|nr:demethylmenaquinone methyltransferase [Streptosporangiaceae bacterium]
MTRAQLDKRPADVAAMFDAVAGRYDLLNDILSAGQCRYWRSVVARAVGAGPGTAVLDIAAGTGTSSQAFAASGATCIACDFSQGMLRAGAGRLSSRQRRRRAGPPAGQVRFVAGDALGLPFADAAFDVVTISFGLRNVADPGAALEEMLRVTKPTGRLVVCEFSHLPVRLLDAAYQRYLASVLPVVASRLSQNPGAYAYLAESIMHWPDQEQLAGVIRASGWSSVRWRNLSGGIVAVHVGRRQGRLIPTPAKG